MINTYVLDTQSLVWFVKGTYAKVGEPAFLALTDRIARVVVPVYALQEMQQKFVNKRSAISIPPSGIVRVLAYCRNVRILPRGAAVVTREYATRKQVQRRQLDLDDQDIAIVAAVLHVRDCVPGRVRLVTSDGKLQKWARSAAGIDLLSTGS